jgi:bisphosphoglycerate-dependent phosphoglycerate mutase
MPDAVDQGKRVLISSSENAIRGLLMHLCEIPESEISGLEIPNGLPLIFDFKSKCVKLVRKNSHPFSHTSSRATNAFLLVQCSAR